MSDMPTLMRITSDMGDVIDLSKVNMPLLFALYNALQECHRKFLAEMALSEKQLTIPTRNEWIGINLLERDDEL